VAPDDAVVIVVPVPLSLAALSVVLAPSADAVVELPAALPEVPELPHALSTTTASRPAHSASRTPSRLLGCLIRISPPRSPRRPL